MPKNNCDTQLIMHSFLHFQNRSTLKWLNVSRLSGSRCISKKRFASATLTFSQLDAGSIVGAQGEGHKPTTLQTRHEGKCPVVPRDVFATDAVPIRPGRFIGTLLVWRARRRCIFGFFFPRKTIKWVTKDLDFCLFLAFKTYCRTLGRDLNEVRLSGSSVTDPGPRRSREICLPPRSSWRRGHERRTFHFPRSS